MIRTSIHRHTTGLFILFTIVAFCLGCGGPSTLVKYYTLSAASDPSSPQKEGRQWLKTDGDQGLAVGVGPLTFPKTIDRPHIVTRTDEHELKVAEFHRWAGSLHEEFINGLCRNLAQFMGTLQVEPYPWESYFHPRWQVYVHVREFDGILGEYALLNVKWRITDRKSAQTLLVRQSAYKETVSGTDYEAFVAAQGRLLTAFSRDVGQALVNLNSR